jgi:hypothetical protein
MIRDSVEIRFNNYLKQIFRKKNLFVYLERNTRALNSK